MTLALVAKILGLIGVVLLSVPVIRDGKFFLLFTSLGNSTNNRELLDAIKRLKDRYDAEILQIRRQDLRYIYAGLFLVMASYILEIALMFL